MDNRELDEFGEKIQDIIEKAVNTHNYEELNRNISRTVNKAVNTGSEALKNAFNSAFSETDDAKKRETKTQEFEARRRREREEAARRAEKDKKRPALYGKTTGERAKGIVMSLFGGIFSLGMGLGSLGLFFTGALVGELEGFLVGGGIMAAFAAAGAAALVQGVSTLGKVKRFGRYRDVLGKNTYCDFKRLAEAAGKPVKFVKKDIRYMIAKGWFTEGHVDEQETCLITSNETYGQYETARKQLEMRQQEAARAAEAEKKSAEKTAPEVTEVLERGNAYLAKIRASNDAIPGEEISAKISRMELIVDRIFERAKSHPEIIPDLKRLMDYYLPMTVKLLDAYEDMDRQPVQGENIRSSKKEIEETLDTLNLAFEKLLDSVFQEVAWDVSSDISVLNTMLAQEGLKEDELTKMQRKIQE